MLEVLEVLKVLEVAGGDTLYAVVEFSKFQCGRFLSVPTR